MKRKLLFVALALLLVNVCFVTSAQAAISTLTSTDTGQTLSLECTFTPLNGVNQFSYLLSNPAANTVVIRGFTLQFPGVPTTDFVVTQTPTGWFDVVVAPDSIINWTWNGVTLANRLGPGKAFSFAFTTALPFGGPNVANASAQNGFGFSGTACGPVVPEPMSVMLGLMGLSSIAGLRRFRR